MELFEQANEPSARTLAARANGAKSCGPKTEAGKASSRRKPDPKEILNWNDHKVATKKNRFAIANKY